MKSLLSWAIPSLRIWKDKFFSSNQSWGSHPNQESSSHPFLEEQFTYVNPSEDELKSYKSNDDNWNNQSPKRWKHSIHFIMFITFILSIIILYFYHHTKGILSLILSISFFIGLFGSIWSLFSFNEKRRQRNRQKYIKERQQVLKAGADNIESLTPVQFEKYCGILLEDKGWSVNYTTATGDYGVDIIAIRNGEKMVVQCKHYTFNVGVSAVQEVFAGKTFYRAQRACVVASRGGFTRSAKKLAEKTGVEVIGVINLKYIK